MFYLTFSMIPSVDLARYGVSRAKDLDIICKMCYKFICLSLCSEEKKNGFKEKWLSYKSNGIILFNTAIILVIK